MSCKVICPFISSNILSFSSDISFLSNPSISYINGIIEKSKKSDVKTLDDIKKLDDEFKKKSDVKNQVFKNTKSSEPTVKTRFHNINQTFAKYTPEELEKMLQESQKNKFK